MSQALQVIPLSRAARHVNRFLEVSYGIYRDDPHWVAPLLVDARKVFSDANPLFQHAEMQLWIATRDGRDVGRIAGIFDRNYNQSQQSRDAFFGFFECEHDAPTSRQLFAAVLDWARQLGAHRVLGPMNPTTNEECGLLVDGFDSPPQLMMTYNPPYYEDLIQAEGFTGAKNLLAFQIDVARCPLERLQRIARQTRRRNPEILFKPVRRRTLAADLDKIKEVYNAAWQRNWGFVPMTGAEIDFLAARLKPLLVEGLVWLAEKPGEPVGFMLALPDYNEVIKPLRGRLCTPKILGLLPYVLGYKLPTRCRVVILGVKEEYRNRGIEAVMLAEGLATGRRLGIKEAEASWVLEDNLPMRRLLEPFGGRVYKTYRIYERAV
ncbi:MAG: GNAT family N-acetyltransferase [Verrucomicrobia bacterium]|nr:GNAT family N-acetyltransferase [Verrucomicrobiota bacterium]